MAPEQIRILTINDAVIPYVKEVEKILRTTVLMKPLRYNVLRFTRDDSAESLGKKIRNGEMAKIPVMIIIGERDMEAKTVSLRTREGEKTIALSELKDTIEKM